MGPTKTLSKIKLKDTHINKDQALSSFLLFSLGNPLTAEPVGLHAVCGMFFQALS
jgi:hypothetical protein